MVKYNFFSRWLVLCPFWSKSYIFPVPASLAETEKWSIWKWQHLKLKFLKVISQTFLLWFIIYFDTVKFFKVLLRTPSSYSTFGRTLLSTTSPIFSTMIPIFFVISLRWFSWRNFWVRYFSLLILLSVLFDMSGIAYEMKNFTE